MNETHLQPARAFHDLNGVTAIEIIGWPGRSEVRAHAAGDRGVSIIAPRRVDGEYWTFQQQRAGVLRCFSDLIGDPHLLTDPGKPMVILLPADRINSIGVTFRTNGGTPVSDHDTTRSRTPALDLEAAEKELDILAKQTKAAYKAYRAASNRQDAVVDKIRELKRQIREGVAK